VANIVGYIVNKRVLQKASSLDGRIDICCQGCGLGRQRTRVRSVCQAFLHSIFT